MAYIDEGYYKGIFKGTEIPEGEFPRLAEIASDVIDSIVTIEIDEDTAKTDNVKKATAYEVEMIYQQGGVDAVIGFASGLAIGSESLGGYSISTTENNGSQVIMRTKDGIPVSSLTISLLKKAGLMCRWAYAGVYKNCGKQ